MTRNDGGQRALRRPLPQAALVTLPPRPLTSVERHRLRQRYAHLAGRSVVLGYTSLGIVVTAATPAEMVETTDAVIAETTGCGVDG